MDDTRRVNEHGDVATIIEGAGAQVPRIQMRAEQHEFVGFLTAANFGNYVFRIRPVHLRDLACPDARGLFVRRRGILRCAQRLRAPRQPGATGSSHRRSELSVAIEQEIGPRGHPEYCGGAGFHGSTDNFLVEAVFVDEVVPSNQQVRMDQNNSVAWTRTGFGEASSSPVPTSIISAVIPPSGVAATIRWRPYEQGKARAIEFQYASCLHSRLTGIVNFSVWTSSTPA